MTTSALHQALTHCIQHRLTFAAFRLPGTTNVTLWAQQTPELDRVETGLWWELNDVFLLSPFLTADRTPLIRSDVELTFGDAEPHWQRLLECTGSATVIGHAQGSSTTRDGFLDAVRQAQAACASGGLEKVVLSRTMELPIGSQDAPALFEEALSKLPDAFVALVSTPEHGTWLGATPERLLVAENESIQVDAVAGTAPAAHAAQEAVAWHEKERHEQRVVTKRIVSDLIDLGARDIVITGPEVLVAGPVAHLRTRITAQVEGRGVEDLVATIHPTPAVCGIPTEQARGLINALEDRDRALYAGFWGPWSADGRMELYVNIRCMQVHENHADLRVGAGITAGSVPEKEWEETEHKADSWRQLIHSTTPA
ncbi:MAG: chorismate-binding protein [Flavobacteriales bacterium]